MATTPTKPTNAPLKKIVTFYCRFTPSYSAIGYYARRVFWGPIKGNFAGQTWLVIGASEGIGGAAARFAIRGGATVIAVARDIGKLTAFEASLGATGRLVKEVADFSLQCDIRALVSRLAQRGTRIDVLVSNVGIQKREQIITREGLETSFATNILGHYLLTTELLAHHMLSDKATVIEVSSGGMYNHAMVLKDLNITGEGYLGVRAYGLSKRAQVMLTAHWRQQYAATGMCFYVMHPGWVDTAAVGRSMPRFRSMLKSVLRAHGQGADTIVWLADKRPAQKAAESIWFDRKERSVHIYEHTPKTSATGTELVAYLKQCLLPGQTQQH